MDAGYRILVIDDDPVFVRATKAVLESHGYAVDTAQDGAQGLARMREQRPDMVLLDVMMAWPLEGVSVSRDMMAEEELRHIPIIMISSIRESEHRGAFPLDEYLHINRWLDKPCSPSKLLSEIEAALTRHERYRRSPDSG